MIDVRKPKILIIGHGRHGKDTVGDIMQRRFGFRVASSSEFAAERAVFPWFCRHYPGRYSSAEECFADRHNHGNRALWFAAISEYNTPERSRLAREMMDAGNDVYIGMRNPEELYACRAARVFDAIIWVDRSEHVLPEGKDSCGVVPGMADFTIDNNGTLYDLESNVLAAMNLICEVA